MSDLKVGDLILNGSSAITRIERVDARQVWARFPTGDPGSVTTLLTPAPWWTVTKAVLGETVCATPQRSGCLCPLSHVPADQLAWLTTTDSAPENECLDCGGNGRKQYDCSACCGFGRTDDAAHCRSCDGSGLTPVADCCGCDGSGRVR